jgi:hypothetical protein
MGVALELHDLLRRGEGGGCGSEGRTLELDAGRRAKYVRACVAPCRSQGKFAFCCPMVGLDFGLTFGMCGPMSFLIKRIWIPKNPLPCPERDAGCWDTQSVIVPLAA